MLDAMPVGIVGEVPFPVSAGIPPVYHRLACGRMTLMARNSGLGSALFQRLKPP
jgi:hypothetical protein